MHGSCSKIHFKMSARVYSLYSYYSQNLYLYFVIFIISNSLVPYWIFDVFVVLRKNLRHKAKMINFEYTLGFMDYATFVVIVAIYFILTIYLNTRVNSNINKNQSGSNSEWIVKEKDENFFSGGLCLHFLIHSASKKILYIFVVALSNIIKYSSWMILLGICNDAYENGIQFLIFFFVGSTFMTIFMNFIIIPVFHESEVSTLSEVS